MIKVEDYRRTKFKKRKVRNWVFLALILVLSFVFIALFGNTENNSIISKYPNITVEGKDIILNITSIDTNFEQIIRKVEEVAESLGKDVNVKIYLDSKLISYYSLQNPEISVLNAKGEKDLAMNVSLFLIERGMNVKNYGNYASEIGNSLIINRTPNRKVLEELSRSLGISMVSNLFFEPSLEGELSGIVVVLGKDFELRKLKK
ncbi:MAG: LytR C-terminal domain-containing protein [Spirochaetia bacterium]|nr:LytR C-terminal domain-containing protein [Spirochaetota bacterium]MCX8096182.1 LytR C-terminal domain-containing protein [Spirochaetota bacterium]MDW8111732.1 LytR C-terminal domain-containing protein [Spirochaetia bacterium]